MVAVAGTHGKTTTTSLLTIALQAAGADPTYAIGGDLAATGVNAAAGAGDLFVAEADESDGAFLHYAPYAAIVTNVEADHLDNWGTEEAYVAAFDEFADTLDPDGFLVCVVDDPGAAALAERHRAAGRRVVTVSAREPGALADVHAVVAGGALPRRRARRAGRRARAGLRRGRPGARAGRPTPAPSAGWSARARPAGSASTTATPTTRPRSPATSRPRARSPGTGRRRGGVPAAPGLAHPHLRRGHGRGARRRRRGRRARRLPRPRGRRPGRDRSAGGRRRAAAGRAGRLRARLRRRRRRAGRPGPARRPGAHPRAPARSPRSRRGCWSCSTTGRAMARSQDPDATQGFDAFAPEPVAPDADPAVLRSRRRFARRQWARRWLAWKPVLAVVLVAALVGGRSLARLLLVVPRRAGGAGRRGRAADDGRGRARPPPCPRASRSPASTSTGSAPGWRRWPPCGPPT